MPCPLSRRLKVIRALLPTLFPARVTADATKTRRARPLKVEAMAESGRRAGPEGILSEEAARVGAHTHTHHTDTTRGAGRVYLSV